MQNNRYPRPPIKWSYQNPNTNPPHLSVSNQQNLSPNVYMQPTNPPPRTDMKPQPQLTQIQVRAGCRPLDEKYLEIMLPNKYGYVSIRNGQWKTQKMDEICRQIQSWPISSGLFLCANQTPQIHMHILHIWFPYLTKLDLGKNQITSIQFLAFIRAPSLKNLSLSDNHLVSLSALRKNMHWGSLLFLRTWGNHLYDISALSALKCPLIQEIDLDYYDDNNIFTNCLPLSKFQSMHIRQLSILGKKRIPQSKFYGCFEKRNVGLEKVSIEVCSEEDRLAEDD